MLLSFTPLSSFQAKVDSIAQSPQDRLTSNLISHKATQQKRITFKMTVKTRVSIVTVRYDSISSLAFRRTISQFLFVMVCFVSKQEVCSVEAQKAHSSCCWRIVYNFFYAFVALVVVWTFVCMKSIDVRSAYFQPNATEAHI